MSDLFSEMLPKEEWKPYNSMLVIRNTNRSYPCYWSSEKNKWSGLLDATIYTDNEVPNISDGEVVDYREITGLIK